LKKRARQRHFLSCRETGGAAVRALRIVRRLCSFCRPRIHAKRFEAVLATVGAVFVAQRLSIVIPPPGN